MFQAETLILVLFLSNSVTSDVINITTTDLPIPEWIIAPIFVPSASTSLEELAIAWNNIACGKTGVCHKQNNKYECTSNKFRCVQCKCDPECTMYRDCCPDVEQWSIQTNISQDSDTYEVHYHCISQAFKVGTNVKSSWYQMIKGCPDVGASESERYACEEPDERLLLAHRPVYSTLTNRTYRNTKCASCHGEINADQLIPWKINITCNGYVDYSRIFTQVDFYTEALHNEHCAINMDPPLPRITTECVEMPDDVISQCNVTGLYVGSTTGDDYQYLQQACAGIQQVVHQVKYNQRIHSFGNIFCAACNGLSIERHRENVPPCRADYPSVTIFSAPLSALFDFNPRLLETSLVPHVNELGCIDTEVYDTYQDTCRPLSCPYGMYNRNHSCLDMMKSVHGQGYRIYVTFTPPNEIDMNTGLATLANAFLNEQDVLNKNFATKHATMTLRIYYFFGRYGLKIANMTFYYTFVNGRHIPRNKAEELLLDYMNQGWYYYKTETEVFVEFHKSAIAIDEVSDKLMINDRDLIGRMISPGLYFASRTFRKDVVTWSTSVYESDSSLYILVNELMRCPSIVLNTTEYVQVGSNIYVHALNKTLSPLEYRTRDKHVSICSEFSGTYQKVEYIQANKTRTSLDTDERYIQTVMSLVCTSVSCLGLLATIIVYLAIRRLRSLPGKCNILLFVNLLIAQVVFQGGVRANVSYAGCVTLGIIIHYFWLTVFGWKWACAFHMFRTFTRPLKHVSTSKTLAVYSIIAHGIPALFVIVYAVLHTALTDVHLPGYGARGFCFISTPLFIGVTFALPVGLVLISNAFFFTKIIAVFHGKSELDKSNCRSTLQESVILLKMSLLLGFTWAVGFVAAATQLSALWYIFIVLNASPGVFIFFTFVVNKRILTECGLVKKKQYLSSSKPGVDTAQEKGEKEMVAMEMITRSTVSTTIPK